MTDRAVVQLLALLVHEIRSPTAALAAIASALRAEPIRGDPLVELMNLASTACRSIAHLVRDAAPGSIRPETVDVAEIVRAAVAGAELGGARVHAAVRSSPLHVHGDPVRLRQALDNVIANATTHSHSGESEYIVVSAEHVGRTVCVSVRDTGVGIEAQHHDRIFEPGVHLDTAVGTGLGLAVARAIAEAHQGTLTVRSTPGEGATFTFAFPLLATG